MPCAAHSAARRSSSERADRALDQKARHHVRRIDDAFALALRDRGRRFALALGLQPFDVGDRLLENMAENGDRHFAPIVPLAELGDILRERVRQDERVGERVFCEQAAIIGPDRRDVRCRGRRRGTSARKLFQIGCGIEFVLLLGGVLQQPVRQKIGALGEGDEEDSVEDFLRGLDRCRAP